MIMLFTAAHDSEFLRLREFKHPFLFTPSNRGKLVARRGHLKQTHRPLGHPGECWVVKEI